MRKTLPRIKGLHTILAKQLQSLTQQVAKAEEACAAAVRKVGASKPAHVPYDTP
jgi:hypothetical protein